MSGRVVLEESPTSIRMRKKTYPILTFFWCIGVMGGVVYCFHRFGQDLWLTILCALISVVGVGVFTALSIYSNRRPYIVEFDRSSGVITMPRFPEIRISSQDVILRVIPAWISSYNRKTYAQILALFSREDSREIPIYCEKSMGLKRPAKAFAREASMDFEICDKRSVKIG